MLPCTGSVCIATAFGLQRSSAICHIVSRCVAVFRCCLFDDDDDDDDDDEDYDDDDDDVDDDDDDDDGDGDGDGDERTYSGRPLTI